MQVCPSLGHLVGLRGLLPEAKIQGSGDVTVGGCACDSRRVQPGELFVALKGRRRDGYDFIPDALVRGCAAVLSDRAVPDAPVPVCLVSNVRESYARVCQTLAGNPSRQLKTIGVMGLGDKTTLSCLIAGVLSAAGNQIGIVGTLGYLDGRALEKGNAATPPPEQLAAILGRTVRNGCSHAVMEVSKRAIEESRLAGVEFDAVCATRLKDACHSGVERTTGKQGSRGPLGQLKHDGFAVLNADDVGSAEDLRRLACPVLTVGIDSPAEIMATPLDECVSEQTFLLTAGSQSVPVRTPMIGRQQIYDCLTAAAVGLACEIELTTVVRGLESAGHVPGRLERIECGQPFGVFVDLARTPGTLRRTMKTLRDVTAERLICVFSARGARDSTTRAALGRAVERGADVAILTEDGFGRDDPATTFRDVLGGCKRPTR
ncbi:MAG: Mur ligase domain-containing protein, partial [Planctomycetaceae bacterium]|nr:Mur ligase domain-containing protein [Planctomycetaceae bacterium]